MCFTEAMLLNLPNETLLQIADHLEHERNISALSRTNRRLYSCLQRFLLQYNIQNSGSSVLLWASEHGDETLIKTVLDEGGSGHVLDRYSQNSALTLAVKHDQRNIVDLLLAFKDIDADWSDNQNKSTALATAAGRGNFTIVDMLLSSGRVDPNKNSGEPLSLAAEKGHNSIVKLLLEHPSINFDLGFRGKSPLARAATEGHLEIVKMLLERGMQPNNGGQWMGHRTPFLWAAWFGHASIVELLLTYDSVVADERYDAARTALSFAAGNGHLEVVEQLFLTGEVDANSRDAANRTPLFWAVNCDYDDLSEGSLVFNSSCREKKHFKRWQIGSKDAGIGWEEKLIRVVELLLENGADPDCKADDGRTPLTIAIERGRAGLVKTLLATGRIDLTHKDEAGRTPFAWAKIVKDQEILSLLSLENL